MTQSRVFNRVLVSLSIFSLLFQQVAFPVMSYAQDGASVVAGSATISQQGNVTNINAQSHRTIINWNKFNIPGGHTTKFNQPNANSAVLNRVVGKNNPTSIYGTLNSNGNVYLVNPSGILIGPSGVINTNGFTASTLDLPDQEFLNGGPLHFSGDSTAGVINQGKIYTGTGGTTLIGNYVINEGLIESLGKINLIAGGSVELDGGGKYIQADAATVQNGISETAGLIKNSGEIRATGAMEVGGEVYLVAPGGKVMQEALVAAQKQNENGDTVGGKVVLDTSGATEATGETNVSGSIDVSGALGGQVVITGDSVALQSANIDASGLNGGGTVNVGGGFQGQDASIANSLSTIVDTDSSITAAATTLGSGGQVVVWGTDEINFHGAINTLGGDGGFVEVSTKGTGVIDGMASTGYMLVDPQDVAIDGALDSVANDPSLVTPAVVMRDTITNVLNSGGTFVINTTGTDVDGDGNSDGGSLGGTGRVLFANLNINVNNNTGNMGTFRIEAADTINTGQAGFLTSGNTGTNYEFYAGTNLGGTPQATADVIHFGQPFNTGGGHVIFDAANHVSIGDPLTTSGGDVTLIARGGGGDATVIFRTNDAHIDSGGGTISIQTDVLQINNSATSDPLIDASTGTVALLPTTAGRTINLGTDTAGSLSLTEANIDRIAADTLRIGSATSGNITISNAISPAQASTLSLITGGGIVDGNASGADVTATGLALQAATSDGLETAVSNLAFNLTGGSLNISNTGALTITDVDGLANSSAAGSVTIAASSLDVANGVVVSSGNTLIFDAPTVNLDGNLTATGGISGTATTINVLGSAGGAELQDAVDVAVNGATVNVSAGSYSGFTIDVENLTVDGVGDTTIVNAASPAITIDANGATVSDMLLQGTGTAGEVGILLDGSTTPNLTGISIINVDFANLDDGIRSQGDIGIGAAADVTIRGNSNVDKSVFEDFLDTAIDVGDTDGDATYVVQDVIVRDGATDGDTVATGGDGMHFGSVGGLTIQRVEISGATDDGIQIAALDAATVSVLDSTISISGSVRHGLNFGTLSNGGDIRISGNTIDAGSDGINFGAITDSTVLVGGATAAEGNSIAGASTDDTDSAIDFNGAISGSTVAVANNVYIMSNGNLQAIEFGAISNGAEVLIVDNLDIGGGQRGIGIFGDITDSTLVIAGNSIAGRAVSSSGASIRFGDSSADSISDSTVTIGSTNVTVDGTALTPGGNTLTGGGIRSVSVVDGDTDLTISDNLIGTSIARVGVDGITFQNGILDTSTVTLDNNTVFATELAIDIDDLQSPSTLSITGGTFDATGGALRVDNTGVAGTDGRLNAGAVNFVGGSGSTVFEVLTDAGNAGVDIDFQGAATFDGGSTGMRLSGPGIDVLNDTFGGILFTNQTGDYITLVDGAEFDPGQPTHLDATGVSFDGTLGSAMTPAQLQALESKLTHYPDNNTLGLINTNDLFVVEGESIQLAVNAAGLLAGPQTVGVSDGTFGGSVEIWVDDLTIVGQGATTIIDTDAVDSFANNGDVDNGFQVAAISTLSGGGNVSGVTIDGFAFDTLSTSGMNIGVELGETGTSTAGGTTVQNSTFTDLLNGIVGHDLGGTTTLSNLDITSSGHGLLFTQALTGTTVDILGNTIDAGQDGIHFSAALDDTDILIDNNDIVGDSDGVDFAGAVSNGSTVTISNNTQILSVVDTVGVDDDGIAFDGAITGAGTSIMITDNVLIEGSDRGISFDNSASITDASVTISGNTIAGLDIDGVLFNNTMTNAHITIGGATDAEGNTITGQDEGLDIDKIVGGTFTIAHNTRIEGTTGDGIEFEGPISGAAAIAVSNNHDIVAARDGVIFESTVTDSTVLISGNIDISAALNGILFTRNLTGSDLDILGNTIVANMDGIRFDRVVDSTDILIDNNDVVGDQNGVGFSVAAAVQNGSIVTISNNSQLRGVNEDGVMFGGAVSGANTEISITGNTQIEGSGGDGIAFEGPISSNAYVEVSNNADITGGVANGLSFESTVTDSTVLISGNVDIAGAINGIVFQNAIQGASMVTVDRNGTATLNGGDYNGTAPVDLSSFSVTGDISGSTGSGISFADINGDTTVTISRNITSGSGGNGITFGGPIASSQTTAVYNNFILGNGGHGIYFGGDILTPVEVFQNFIAGNGGDAIQVGPAASINPNTLFVQQNFIPGAGFAHGNGGFGFNHLGIGTPNIEGNWWGGFTMPEVASAINGVGHPTAVLLFGDDTNIPAALGQSGLDPFAFQNSAALPVEAIEFALDDNRFLTYDRFTRYQDYFFSIEELLDLTGGASLPPTGLPGPIQFEQDEEDQLPVIIPSSRTSSGR